MTCSWIETARRQRPAAPPGTPPQEAEPDEQFLDPLPNLFQRPPAVPNGRSRIRLSPLSAWGREEDEPEWDEDEDPDWDEDEDEEDEEEDEDEDWDEDEEDDDEEDWEEDEEDDDWEEEDEEDEDDESEEE